MANFAVIVDGKVENIIVADSLEIAQEVTSKTCVEYTDENPAYLGLGYDGKIFEQPKSFEAPLPPAAPQA